MVLLSNRHILIVEDNPQNRVIFQMSLIRDGALVEFERWGRDMLARLENSPHTDLIVMDLMLAQGVSGFELFDQVRNTPRFAQIPIVAVSAMDFAIAAPKARSMGFSGFISKPIENYLFPQQIASVLHGEEVWYERKRSL
ncbi:MAG: response regulator [Chloroflexi bacterium]|nr:response regulator [Chloroflexota bacterium]